MSRTAVLCLALSVALLPLSVSAVAAPPDTRWDWEAIRPTLDDALLASGCDDRDERVRLARSFLEIGAAIASEIGPSRNPYRTARRIHRAVHSRLLRRYRADADGLDEVLRSGEYNCVSAALIYGLLTRAAGLDARVVETPRHLFVRLVIDRQQIDVETTASDGFDMRRRLSKFRRFALAYKYATAEDLSRRGAAAIYDEFFEVGSVVDVAESVAFLWQNTGLRAVNEGRPVAAAEAFREAFRIHPGLAENPDGFRVSMARAFLQEYDAGRFSGALRIAAIDLDILPGRTSAVDRFLAAARKRIEVELDAGRLDGAEILLRWAARRLGRGAPMERLERDVCPEIASVAVREGAWEVAVRMAERFVDVEPDEIEATRLLEWVRARREGARNPAVDDVCTDRARPDPFAGP